MFALVPGTGSFDPLNKSNVFMRLQILRLLVPLCKGSTLITYFAPVTPTAPLVQPASLALSARLPISSQLRASACAATRAREGRGMLYNQLTQPVASTNSCLIAGVHLRAATRDRHMDTEKKSFLSWMFVWAGIPLLFAGTSWLTYYILRNERLSDHKADWICLGIMFALVSVGIFLVRDRLRPRSTWVAPVYGGVMLVSLFTVLAFISLQFAGDL